MLKAVISFWLWIAGGLFFFFSFLILIFSMFVFSRQKTFEIAKFLFTILLKIMRIDLTVTGREHVDPEKTYLIMGNHQSLFDIFVIPVAIPLCFTAIEAAHHFSLPIWGYLVRKWGCIPIERSNLKNAISSLGKARKTLGSGMSIAVLPEGHRTLTGNMLPFKKGPFHLAKDAGADILPFGMVGLFDYNRKSAFFLNPGKVYIHIGQSIPYDTFKKLSVNELRQKLYDTIYDLSHGSTRR